jgi:hypothetical protein
MRTFLVLGLLLNGCAAANSPFSSNAGIDHGSAKAEVCPEKPIGSLESNKVKAITLNSQDQLESGMVRAGESVGFSFESDGNERFNYTTKSNLCVWIFSPDNQIMRETQLSQKGRYIVQVSTPTGTTSFDLAMRLGDSEHTPVTHTTPLPSPKSQDKATQPLAKAGFPKAACGDSRPSSLSAYPVTFYPVQVPNTEINLNKARSQFCADAFVKISQDTGEKIVQIASFINQRNAQEFMNLIGSEINGAKVGLSTTIYRPRSE